MLTFVTAFIAIVITFLWLFSKLDCDLQVLWAEKFGRPISDLRGKVVWITGASSGIGEALAYILAANGVKLVISGTNRNRLEEVKQKCIHCGQLQDTDVLILCFDMKNLSDHQKYFNSVVSHFKKLDILVANAGRSQRALFEDIDIEVDKELFEINVFGLINLSRIVLRYFLQNKIKGHFMVTSSTAGKLGVPNSASYTASKHALHGYFECLRIESKMKGISVTMVCPGPVFSRVLEAAFTDKIGKSTEQTHSIDNKRMTASRCAHLMATALVNNLDESWMAIQPVLAMHYFSQYLPTISRKLFPYVLTPERMVKLREGSK
ncbi:dehydrogenase/reductase SDR family member 7-like [Oppia nitens]|uniref:dehydrogenase/reductase SDR family member 7-like n=1 Tax=Oppia nitens TaxID=1686743 RepID=UPI0023DBBDB8|nr:dehydrogenase/reductase SDR family member 7-like [Oppia nitens]